MVCLLAFPLLVHKSHLYPVFLPYRQSLYAGFLFFAPFFIPQISFILLASLKTPWCPLLGGVCKPHTLCSFPGSILGALCHALLFLNANKSSAQVLSTKIPSPGWMIHSSRAEIRSVGNDTHFKKRQKYQQLLIFLQYFRRNSFSSLPAIF